MKKFIKTIMILIVSLALSISTPITTAYHSYAQQLNKKPIKYVETYTNPMYKGLNVKTYSQGSNLSKSNSKEQVPVFNTIDEAGMYLRKQMVKRLGQITFGIKMDCYKNILIDIFNVAVKDDGYTSSSEGDYLYANWNGCSSEVSYTSEYLKITLKMKYLSTYSQEQAVDREVSKVLNQLNVYNKNDYIKIKAVHDYIAKNIEYDYSLNNHSGYNAIVDKKVVCQGFSSITCKILKELGVGVRYITGDTKQGYHAWNIVKIDDYWYNTDNTWDACYTDGYGSVDYTWFLKGSSEFGDHSRDSKFNTLQFKKDFPTSYKSYVYEGEHPVINGAEDKTIKVGESFDARKGITAYDEEDGDLTSKIVVNGSVNTNKAGTYTLTYKVTDSDGNTTTVKRKITVKSNEKPVINGAEDKTIKVGESFNERAGVTAYDKEDGNLTNKIVINGSVNTNKAGKYTLTYKVTDSDRNTTTVRRIITVKSNEKPVINGAEDKTIKVGESFNERAGVTAYDKEDGNLTNKIVINGSVNTNKAGKYTLTYQVTDSDGNTTTVRRIITVKSNEKPVINGAEDKTIKVGESFDERAGVTAYDEEDGNLTNKIVINGSVNTNKAGKYTLTYQVTDSDRNTTTVRRIITVKSNEKPVINGAEDKTIKVGENFDAREGVTAYDEEDGNLTNKIVINGSVNTNKAGEYTLTYKVTDSDGNTTTATRKITVKSNEKPVINGAEDKTIKVGESFDEREGVTVYDEEDGDLTNKIVINGSVNTNKTGTYTLTYKVTDSDGNTTTATRKITVRSNEKPVINGAEDKTIKVGENFDAREGVTAYDEEDGNLINKIVINGSVNTNKVGMYTLTYKVTDSDGNTTTATRKITVRSNEKPVINGAEDKTIKVGENFDAREGVTAYDKEDGDLTNKIVINGSVNTNKAGKYTLTYQVTDNDRNTTKVKRIITVKSNTFKVFTVNSVKTTSTSISGKGLKGAKVKAYVNGKQIGKTVTVNSSGNYKITIPKQIGGKKIVLKMSKSGYITKEISTIVLKIFPSFKINSVKTTSTSISGKGLKGAKVKAYVNGKQIGKTVTVNSSGNYKITIPKQKKGKKITVQMSKSGYSTVEKSTIVK